PVRGPPGWGAATASADGPGTGHRVAAPPWETGPAPPNARAPRTPRAWGAAHTAGRPAGHLAPPRDRRARCRGASGRERRARRATQPDGARARRPRNAPAPGPAGAARSRPPTASPRRAPGARGARGNPAARPDSNSE